MIKLDHLVPVKTSSPCSVNVHSVSSTFFFSLQHLVNLFARLANDNIGYIDWDPYIPKVGSAFTPLQADSCHPQPCLFGVCGTAL